MFLNPGLSTWLALLLWLSVIHTDGILKRVGNDISERQSTRASFNLGSRDATTGDWKTAAEVKTVLELFVEG